MTDQHTCCSYSYHPRNGVIVFVDGFRWYNSNNDNQNDSHNCSTAVVVTVIILSPTNISSFVPKQNYPMSKIMVASTRRNDMIRMIHHSMKERSRWVHSSSSSRMVRLLSTGSCEIVPASSATTTTTTTTTTAITKDDRFLRQVETTIQRVVDHYRSSYGLDILLQRRTNNNNNNNSNNNNNTVYDVPYTAIPIHEEREMVGIVRHLHERMQSIQQQHICRRCWLQCTYCICHQLIPILPHLLLPTTTTTTTRIGSSIWMIRRIFLLTHHKEIGMMMDTMKVILCAFPEVCRLVVAGIPGPYQDSMTELMTALSHHQKDDHQTDHDDNHPSWTLVLYPAEDAKTFSTFWEEQQQQQQQQQQQKESTTTTTDVLLSPIDIVVMDGTWEQTRRFYNRYIRSSSTTMPSSSSSKTSVQCIQLSSESLRSLQPQEEFGEGKKSNVNDNTNNNHTNHPHHPHYGRQLRPHPIAIREIATAYALQLLLQDIVSVMGTTTTGTGAVGTGNCHSPPCTFYEYQQIATMAALRQQQQPILYDGTNHQS
jgi:hypothetical protein